jgi:hypothetical protein
MRSSKSTPCKDEQALRMSEKRWEKLKCGTNLAPSPLWNPPVLSTSCQMIATHQLTVCLGRKLGEQAHRLRRGPMLSPVPNQLIGIRILANFCKLISVSMNWVSGDTKIAYRTLPCCVGMLENLVIHPAVGDSRLLDSPQLQRKSSIVT